MLFTVNHKYCISFGYLDVKTNFIQSWHKYLLKDKIFLSYKLNY